MTREGRKSVRAAAGVLLSIAAMCAGALLRDQLDLGTRAGSDLRGDGLLASTSKTTDLPETTFFEDMLRLLEQKYVEPISDENKLADGAVRGMVASLSDPNSLFMDATQYAVYSKAREGKFEGIGVHCALARDRSRASLATGGIDDAAEPFSRFPLLKVVVVVPGSSADKAGIQVGDLIESVDGRWVPNSAAFDELDRLSKLVKEHKASGVEFLKARSDLREKIDKSVIALKARDRLMIGSSGPVRVGWIHQGKRQEKSFDKGEWTIPTFEVRKTGEIRFSFVPGVADRLRKALLNRTEATLDLRSNVYGDFDAMLACLREVAPKGVYGSIATHKNEKPWPIEVTASRATRVKLKVLVDEGTLGVADMFARALASRSAAKIMGHPGGDPLVIQWFRLPEGGGYTLVTGEYRSGSPNGIVAENATQRKVAEQ